MIAGKLYTKDQTVRVLVDDALFSESLNARIKAISQLATDYRLEAVPIIEEVMKILPATDDEFRAFCVNVISKIRDQAGSGKRLVGLWI